jgi:hypothetical protein
MNFLESSLFSFTIHSTYTFNFFDQSIDNYRMPPLEHCVSDHADTPYSTPSARQIMSEISCEPLDDVEVVLEEEIVLEEKSQESDVI